MQIIEEVLLEDLRAGDILLYEVKSDGSFILEAFRQNCLSGETSTYFRVFFDDYFIKKLWEHHCYNQPGSHNAFIKSLADWVALKGVVMTERQLWPKYPLCKVS